jgi:hypothetical protein
MRMGAVVMRLSNITLTSPAVTGLIMVAVLVLGAIVVRVVAMSVPGEVSAHSTRETGGQGTLNRGNPDRGASDRATFTTGVVGLRGTLP